MLFIIENVDIVLLYLYTLEDGYKDVVIFMYISMLTVLRTVILLMTQFDIK